MSAIEVIAFCIAAVVVAAILCALAVALAVWWTRRHAPRCGPRPVTDKAVGRKHR